MDDVKRKLLINALQQAEAHLHSVFDLAVERGCEAFWSALIGRSAIVLAQVRAGLSSDGLDASLQSYVGDYFSLIANLER